MLQRTHNASKTNNTPSVQNGEKSFICSMSSLSSVSLFLLQTSFHSPYHTILLNFQLFPIQYYIYEMLTKFLQECTVHISHTHTKEKKKKIYVIL